MIRNHLKSTWCKYSPFRKTQFCFYSLRNKNFVDHPCDCKQIRRMVQVNKHKASLTSHRTCTYVLVTEKSPDLQGTLKLQVRFYNRILRLQTPHNENWHANYFLRARSMATNTSMSQGQLTRDLGTCILFTSVVGSSHLLTLFPCAL